MCNLNIVIRRRENLKSSVEDINLLSYLQSATALSYSNNSDGDGVYMDNEGKDVLYKTLNKTNLNYFMCELCNSKFILTHQRTATHGLTAEYTQPFDNKNFVLMHNGVLSEFAFKEASDTHGFFMKFLEAFKIQNGTREEKIIKAIKSLLNNSRGWYSIALYDKKTQKLYYFKDDFSKIFFYRSKNYLILTTNEDNAKFLSLLEEDFNKLKKIKNYTIYKISCDNDINITALDRISEIEAYPISKRADNYLTFLDETNPCKSFKDDYINRYDNYQSALYGLGYTC